MDRSRETTNQGRSGRRGMVAFLLLALGVGWLAVSHGVSLRDAFADRTFRINTDWLKYQEGTDPRVLKLSADILAAAAARYDASKDPLEQAEILEVVDELHLCMEGKHAEDRKADYKKLKDAKAKAANADTKDLWEKVKLDLMHGHNLSGEATSRRMSWETGRHRTGSRARAPGSGCWSGSSWGPRERGSSARA